MKARFSHKGLLLIFLMSVFLIVTSFSLPVASFGHDTSKGCSIANAQSFDYVNSSKINLLNAFGLTERDITTPFKVVNSTQFPNTLVTFSLPPHQYSYEYASIVVVNDTLDVYYWNQSGAHFLFNQTGNPTGTWSQVFQSRSSGGSNVGFISKVSASYYRIKLTPQVNTVAIHVSYYVGTTLNGQLESHTIAAGYIYVEYGVEITGIDPSDSGYWVDNSNAALCDGPPAETNGVDTSVGYIQQNAGYALLDCPITTQWAHWPSADVDIYYNIIYPSNTPATEWTALACGCIWWSFNFPSIP
jgi:hypothetical protein